MVVKPDGGGRSARSPPRSPAPATQMRLLQARLAHLRLPPLLLLQSVQELLVQAPGSLHQSPIPFNALHLQPQPQGHEAGEMALESRHGAEVAPPSTLTHCHLLYHWPRLLGPRPPEGLNSTLFTSTTPGHWPPWAWGPTSSLPAACPSNSKHPEHRGLAHLA